MIEILQKEKEDLLKTVEKLLINHLNNLLVFGGSTGIRTPIA